MNYDKTIYDLIVTIKEDKTIIQPWRNKSVARLEEAQAFVRMGKTSSAIKPEGRVELSDDVKQICICSPDMPPRKDCPIHGQR